MSSPNELLQKALKIMERDLEAMEKRDAKGKMPHYDSIDLSRYISVLDTIQKTEVKQLEGERKKASSMSDEEMEQLVQKVLGKSND